MSDFNAKREWVEKPAQREAVPPLIALWGGSGSGKTRSALLLARGLVGEGKKIALIDTENGRAKLHADAAGGWHHIDFQPPFSPKDYTEAFRFAIANGADAIIVDSASHVWEGTGGVMDQAAAAEAAKGKKLGLNAWAKPKLEHKAMMNNFLRIEKPVIFCLRQKELNKQDAKGTISFLGHIPIAEKNFIYEMTVALHMIGEGRYQLGGNGTTKLPPGLSIPIEGIVSEATGAMIRDWIAGGVAFDGRALDLRRAGMDHALVGTAALKSWFESLATDDKARVKPYLGEMKAQAAQSDLDNEQPQTGYGV